jgi:sugar porter (SP) family MFS transporter
MNRQVVFWSITVALGGFLFGFDTAVISGAEQAIQQVWSLDSVRHGLTVSIALFGTVLGALTGGIPADRFGRKNTLMGIAALYLLSALGSAMAPEWYSFLVFRFIGGLGVGASSVAAPMYIAEISPKDSRGRLVALFQFNIVLGILIAYLSNFMLRNAGEGAWRWMLGVETLPALAFLLMVFRVPESPRWLVVKRANDVEAGRILRIVNPATAEEELAAIKATVHTVPGKGESLFQARYRFPVILAVLFAVFNQVSGINAIIYYAPRIFEMTGLGKGSALLSTAGIGLINFLFTLLAINYIDRIGRRTLMLIGSIGLILTLGLVALSFGLDQYAGVPVFLFVYIAFFAFSQGAVIWVFISEIFPNEIRAKGQSLGSFTHWLLAALIAFSFPPSPSDLAGRPFFPSSP